MKIYTLTSRGRKIARTTNNPDTTGWQIIHFLDKVGESTSERIVSYVGASSDDTMSALRTLVRSRIVTTE